jgi:hypothetical protein
MLNLFQLRYLLVDLGAPLLAIAVVLFIIAQRVHKELYKPALTRDQLGQNLKRYQSYVRASLLFFLAGAFCLTVEFALLKGLR